MADIIRQRNEGEPYIIPNGDPFVAYQARIGAIVNFPVLEDQGGKGYIEQLFEKYVRAPGCRVIAIKNEKIYLQKEKRLESNQFEWRLPGGKVIDSFEKYKQYLNTEVPDSVVLDAALGELQEEAGLTSNEMEIFQKRVCGTTVEWDLIYVVAKNAHDFELNRVHEEAEEMDGAGWFTFDEIELMCKTGEIYEGRTVSVLLQYIHQQKNR